MSQKDVYVAKMKLQLDELNLKMAQIEAKAGEAGHDAKAAYAEEVARLRALSREAADKLDAVKASAADSWHAMVADMETLHQAFTRSFAYFKSQI